MPSQTEIDFSSEAVDTAEVMRNLIEREIEEFARGAKAQARQRAWDAKRDRVGGEDVMEAMRSRLEQLLGRLKTILEKPRAVGLQEMLLSPEAVELLEKFERDTDVPRPTITPFKIS